MYLLGIDCGGTHLRVGIVNQNGKVLGYQKHHSPLSNNAENLGVEVKRIFDELMVKLSLENKDFGGVGIATPGPLDLETGLILTSANLKNKVPIPIKSQLQKYFSVPLAMDLDTRAGLRGEIWQGGASGCREVVMITLGTGVGGAVMTDGKIIEGESGKAGEIGHIFLRVPELANLAVNNTIPVCGLGHRGCFESLIKASRTADDLGYYLGYGLVSIVDIFNPEKVLIGGGRIKQNDFLPQALEIMKSKGMHPQVDEVKVEFAHLGDVAAVIGITKLVMDLYY